jgi:hypothetical protein
METLVSLEYPNGRIHMASVDAREEIGPGYEFELHGRRWRAVKLVTTGRSGLGRHAGRILCVAVSNPEWPPNEEPRQLLRVGRHQEQRDSP